MSLKRTRWLAAGALVAYCAVVIQFVVFKAIPTLRVGHMRLRLAGSHTGPGNFFPFKTIASQLTGRGNHLMAMVNLMGNVLPFVPIGLLAPFVFRSFSWGKALALGVATGLTCEVMEVVFRVGIFDIDDVILNAVGVVVGYGAYVLFRRGAQPRTA